MTGSIELSFVHKGMDALQEYPGAGLRLRGPRRCPGSLHVLGGVRSRRVRSPRRVLHAIRVLEHISNPFPGLPLRIPRRHPRLERRRSHGPDGPVL
ncbi:MAG: hypothetical protein MZU97_18990 [Bacillus subtilis]|nr:hypothetical protein [Bacillus subtilis]